MKKNFQTVASQAADVLKEEIAKGTWKNALPGERKLALSLKVSRKTIRSALAELRAEKVIQSRKGRPNEIANSRYRRRNGSKCLKRIGLLLREPVEKMRPYTVLWINDLRERLRDSGLALEIHHSRQFFGRNADRSLRRLVKTTPSECWVLATSSHALQKWFCQAGLPAIIAGSAHADISLSSVDADHRALCRHATIFLQRNGHRKIALFLSGETLGGDVESEAGYREALADYGSEQDALIVQTGFTAKETIAATRRILEANEPATALVLSSPLSYLTIFSYLASLGKRVPQDISLISCQEEPFFDYLYPSPTYYLCPPARFATELALEIKRAVKLRSAQKTTRRIVPDFVQGASVTSKRPVSST